MPSAATLKRPEEARALAEAERLLAQTNRSGVRAIAPESSDVPGVDMSNAVTKVQRAIELDAFLPPTVEVSVVVNETIALVGSAADVTTEVNAPSPRTSRVDATPSGAAEPPPDTWSDPLARPRRARRILAALLFAVVMMGALTLLVVALSRRGDLPAPALRVLERLFHAGR